MIFLLAAVFICIFSLADYLKVSYDVKRIIKVCFIVIFVFIAGFRSGPLGWDYENYTSYFNNSPNLFYLILNPNILFTENLRYGIGFSIINSFIKLFTDNSHYYFVLCSILTTLLLAYNIKTYLPRYRLIAFFVYFGIEFLALDFIYQRQIIAVQFFVYSLRYIKEKKLYKYLLFILIAGTFHSSAWFLFPLYFILNRFISNKQIIIYLGVGVCLFILNIDIFSPILNVLKIERFEAYSGDTFYNIKRTIGVTHIELLVMVSLILINRNKINALGLKYANIFINLYFFYAILILYFSSVTSVSGRFKFYFNISTIFIIPILFMCIKNKKLIFTYHFALTIYVIASLVYLIYFYNFNGFIPPYQVYENYLLK